MDKTCGTCHFWQPGIRKTIGSITHTTHDPRCALLDKVRYAEDKPYSFCWMRASDEQIASRVGAGLIEGEG
jgi:hypothetical protein